MRICLYTTSALPKLGGQEQVVDILARKLQKQGQEVVVFAPHPRLPLRAADDKLPYPVVRHPRFLSNRFLVDWYLHWLSGLYRQFPFDVLHCHGVYPAAYLACQFQQRHPIPYAITSHGDLHPESFGMQKSTVRTRIERAVRCADRLIALSDFIETSYRSLGGISRQILRIPNGVELDTFAQPVKRPADLHESIRPGNYFLFLGRLKQRKGVDLLLHALARMPSDKATQLVIAGDGMQREQLQELAKELGLGNRVCFLGPVFDRKKTYLLQNALCTLMPSRVSEGFGLVALESYAAGTPVMSSNIPGLRELIQHNRTGWLVNEETPEDWARCLQHISNNPELCGEKKFAVSELVHHYSWDSVTQKYLHMYENLVSPVVVPAQLTRLPLMPANELLG